jgi:hypothetical protein
MQENTNEQENMLTTDDLIFIIGEKEASLFQKNKKINFLTKQLNELYKLNVLSQKKLEDNDKTSDIINNLKEENEKKINNLKEENKKIESDYKIVINKLNKKIENLRTQIKLEEFKEEENNL